MSTRELPVAQRGALQPVPRSAEWLAAARRARFLSWLSLACPVDRLVLPVAALVVGDLVRRLVQLLTSRSTRSCTCATTCLLRSNDWTFGLPTSGLCSTWTHPKDPRRRPGNTGPAGRPETALTERARVLSAARAGATLRPCTSSPGYS